MELLLLQGGPTNTNASSTFFVEQQNVQDSLVEQVGGEEGSDLDCSTFLVNTKEEMKLEYLEEEEETQQKSLPCPFPSLLLEDKMPFLQMLQSVESSLPLSSSFTHQPHLQHLLYTLEQQQKKSYLSKEMELESCITHETKEDQHFNGESSNSGEEEKSYCNKDQGGNWVSRYREYNSEGPPPPQQVNEDNNNYNEEEEGGVVERRKKRKRSTRPSKKNKEEVETQRMTHIAVERNRRKQMNDHLNVLRSLMPSSFVQRGDQASIIGGAIDFVKELEQHLQSLEAQKRTRSSSSKSEPQEEEMKRRKSFISSGGFFTSPQYTSYSSSSPGVESDEHDVNMSRMGVADIEVTVIQSHVNLKILSPRRPGQLLRAIASFEDIRLTVLHLNVTSFDRSVLYSFNLKIEDECELGSADEIAAAVYHIFSYIRAT